MFVIQRYNLTVLLGYPPPCNETVIYLSILENTSKLTKLKMHIFLQLSINAHRNQSFFVFQGLHCL